MPQPHEIEALWRELLTTGEPGKSRRHRHFFRLIPSSPRCQMCNAPFSGFGGFAMKTFFGKSPSNKNPKFCCICSDFSANYRGGAEVELTMLFADVRGSTTIAEGMSASEFSRLMNRFYAASNQVLVESDAFIDKLVGDEVIGLYLPGFAGADHARKAVDAAIGLLHATGCRRPDGAWLPVGVGLHTGVAYVGTVGTKDTVTDVTALGDAVNITARLASAAGPGEILLTASVAAAAAVDTTGLVSRRLELKGRSEAVEVHVLAIGNDPA